MFCCIMLCCLYQRHQCYATAILGSVKEWIEDRLLPCCSAALGLSFEKYNDIKVGDIVEAYVMEQIEQ